MLVIQQEILIHFAILCSSRFEVSRLFESEDEEVSVRAYIGKFFQVPVHRETRTGLNAFVHKVYPSPFFRNSITTYSWIEEGTRVPVECILVGTKIGNTLESLLFPEGVGIGSISGIFDKRDFDYVNVGIAGGGYVYNFDRGRRRHL